mmetsp:Transcript_14279/g.35472  ORF Transcript_14279/g.35472 Transcript_14279/m.35472 type:complete len:417 (-) Transcript_14279:448-1698(-)|eukprot:CAMPEP_0178991948 /NCGR_PEP_ID=MMETSP0795-20121207/5827_1 /TAXON_ID=88552 /ORGANISM="Amoebophrya sp., Strain Ameob2" /LENGTH=416 /DNA_ID=CAMNT_0020683745 /DNA_START=320 /DNA_END=1570 /DNA_ORIENTATION=-
MPTATSAEHGRSLLPWEESLRNIPPEQAEASLTIIEKLIQNVVKDPVNEKFKRIKLSNPKIHANITQIDPALEALLLMGWELLDEDTLFLPDDLMLNVSDYPGRIMEAKAWFAKAGRAAKQVGKNALTPTSTAAGTNGGSFSPTARAKEDVSKDSCVDSEGLRATAAGTKASVQGKSAFQFQNRAAKEQIEKSAAQSLAELRKQKAQEFLEKPPESSGFGDFFGSWGASAPVDGGAVGTSTTGTSTSGAAAPSSSSAARQPRSSLARVPPDQQKGQKRYNGSNVELREMNEPLLQNDQPTADLKHIRPAQNFQKEVERNESKKAAEADDLRAIQRAKYNQAKKDPSLQEKALRDQSRVQNAGSSCDAGNQDDGGSWWNPFSGGGGGSSGGPPGPSGGRGGPRIKTMKDMPKPVRRG